MRWCSVLVVGRSSGWLLIGRCIILVSLCVGILEVFGLLVIMLGRM